MGAVVGSRTWLLWRPVEQVTDFGIQRTRWGLDFVKGVDLVRMSGNHMANKVAKHVLNLRIQSVPCWEEAAQLIHDLICLFLRIILRRSLCK